VHHKSARFFLVECSHYTTTQRASCPPFSKLHLSVFSPSSKNAIVSCVGRGSIHKLESQFLNSSLTPRRTPTTFHGESCLLNYLELLKSRESLIKPGG